MSDIRQRTVENMQKFSRAMIGAVLFLPVIGLILALSSVLTNPTLIPENSVIHNIGQLLGDTFWPLFGNLGLLFCVGISYGLAKDKKTEVALVAVMCFIMFLGANHSWLELTHHVADTINGEYYGTGQTRLLGFVVVDMGVFLGIILGCTIAWVHNKVSQIELPGALSMYGGAKLTLIAMTPVVLLYAIAFTTIWPFMTHGITALTGFMKNAGVAGVFVYGFFEKFLIPTGLHHFVWSPFQLTQIGGTLTVDGQTVSGTQAIFLAYMRHPDLTPIMNDALRFSQQGMTTIFGLSGAALAFYHTATPAKKQMAKAILLPAIITSILTGITEPIEFTFLFVSPLLWVIHATLTAASQAICDLFSVRPWGASGLIEFVIYNLPLPVALTRWPLYIVIGIGQFAAYYVIFRTLVVKLNLKTPGREDDDEVKLYSKQDYQAKNKQKNNDVTDEIINGLGGRENIVSVDNCFTRLRVAVKDLTQVNDAILKSTGANGVVRNNNEVQVIYGVRVGQIRSRVDVWLAQTQTGSNV
ncbi:MULTISPECIES: PTS transporter subunit EIIC [Atlantibacter]|uniref:Maltose/glucose-specific phosphotransferase system enzyme IICB component n=1 Tax=Atlantibacter hermannii NBRC 105704 TaxID=1115512 RepID=H5V1I3_ATLHE|nr:MULTISPECIES: PTS transporter subunit EIIC [Atlantibacter]MCQ4967777.1 PTS transporter subunit EIIC [Enterobacteriaceae bacterium DFI.7.85]MBW9429344.1 PTS transporter subunit EIIC [Atlantibacter hermannii]MDQ7882270.1 PTS transporter subunit EIIC [Atlantibacter hermannii]MDU1951948.1 PTS transporter subunit EIIC [Atlantibacter hermannii]MDU7813279.1 PTS transporter subunit EIIC [Atlantibacter hermannii]